MATTVMRQEHAMPCLFLEATPATNGRSNVQVLIRSEASRVFDVIRVLIVDVDAPTRLIFGENAELVGVQWLITEIDGHSIDWIRADSIRTRYENQGC